MGIRVCSADGGKLHDLGLRAGRGELLEQSTQVPVRIVSVGFGGFDNAE